MKMLRKFSRLQIHNKAHNSEYSTHIILKRYYSANIILKKFLIKPQKCCYTCKYNHCRTDTPCICRHTSPYLYSIPWVFLSQ